MVTNDHGTANPGEQFSAIPARPNAACGGNPGASASRRSFMKVLLGGGFLASAVAFLYPVVRYLTPPKTADLGGDSVVAGKIGELKPNSGKIFRFGSRPGLLIRTASGRLPRHVGHLHPSLLHGPVSRRSARGMVRLS